MTDPAAAPRAARLATPTWLDTRLVLGVLLVLVSVVVGARLLAGDEQRQAVWVLTRDLAPGSVLTEADLRSDEVRLFALSGGYVTGPPPVGYVLLRGAGSGELLPAAGIARPQDVAERREVSVPVERGRLPEDLREGQQVDVYATPDDLAAGQPALVLSDVTVQSRPRDGGLSASQTEAVVLSVPAADVEALVTARAGGTIDLVRVPRALEASAPSRPPSAPAPLTAPTAPSPPPLPPATPEPSPVTPAVAPVVPPAP